MQASADDFLAGDDEGQAPFPLAPDVWKRIAEQMRLSDQQRAIVELLLQRKKCKQIGPASGIAQPTVETYLKRVYQRHGVRDHTELLLHIMALSQQVPRNGACRGES
ncbi:MAG: hypothetical protein KF708_21630 [Pirellulales bacterium]|nr:hypothetical protein [Pirellulales bacterium]